MSRTRPSKYSLSSGGYKTMARARGKVRASSSRASGFGRRNVYTGSAGENKFFDTNRTVVTLANTGTILNLSLNLIPQGVTESTRIGRKCTIKSLSIKALFNLPSSNTGASTAGVGRFIIYLDKQANGATAAVTDILETATVRSHNNLSNSGRFKTLKVCEFVMKAHGAITTAASEDVHWESFTLSGLNIPIEFSSTAGAITEIRSNNIGVLGISSDGLITANYTVRVRFSG